MVDRPLEDASSKSVRAVQTALVALLLLIWATASFPLQIDFVHIAIVLIAVIAIAEAYLSLSRRSVLNENHERRVNELVIWISHSPIGWPLRSIIELAERRNENLRRERAIVRARQFVEKVEIIVTEEFDRKDWLVDGYEVETVAASVVSQSESPGPHAVKDTIVPEIVDFSSDDRLLVTVLIIAKLQTTAENVYEHKQAIAQCLENFDFTNPGEPEKNLLRGYSDLQSILDSEDDDSRITLEGDVAEPEQIYEKMMDRHYPIGQSYPAYNKTTLREYKRNIAKLVQAELSVGATQSKLIEDIMRERERLRQETGNRGTFLLITRVLNWDGSVGGNKDIDRILARKFDDYIKFGRKYETVDPETGERSDTVKVNMWLISVETRYASGSAFYRSEIDSILPEEVIAFAAKVNTPLGPEYDREALYETAESSKKVDEVLSQGDLLFAGHQEEELTVRAIENMVDRDVSAEDLLSAVQLRSVTNATEEESRRFAKYRGDIEDALGIESVFEWADVNPEKAGKKIVRVLDADNQERWTELTNSLSDTVRNCKPPEILPES